MEKVAKKIGISYRLPDEHEFDSIRHKLDVFFPENKYEQKNVVVFIHGGTWINGSKDIYGLLGINLAEKGIVAVNINYRLGETVDFRKMAIDCASAVKWTYENIADFGGDKERITICGHSAGGHLASLITLDNRYFESLKIKNPIKKCILIDAFGLNIGSFIRSHGSYYLHQIEKIFTREPTTWDLASPVNHIKDKNIPFLILVGSQTYPFLKNDNDVFTERLRKTKTPVDFKEITGKSHVEMITQFENSKNPLYQGLLQWIFTEHIVI